MIFTIGYEKLNRDEFASIVAALSPKGHTMMLIDVRKIPNNRFSRNTPNSFSGKSLVDEFEGRYEEHRELGGDHIVCSPESVEFLRQYDTHDTTHCLLICKEENPGACHRHHSITAHYFPDSFHIFRGYAVWEADFDDQVERGIDIPDERFYPVEDVLTMMSNHRRRKGRLQQ
jgi:hypothetical protein